MSALLWIAGVAFLLAFVPLVYVLVRGYLRARGKRIIVCPDSKTSEVVEVDARRASWTGVTRDASDYRLVACSRWPELRNCGQECLSQIESAPDGCLIRERLVNWYEDALCAVCGRSIDEIHWFDRRPALLGPEGKTSTWSEVPAAKLEEVLATHRPLCWNCHVAATFRARFPELVVDDPLRPAVRPSDRSSGFIP